MVDKQIIDALIGQGRLDEAVSALTGNIGEEPERALWPYLRGRLRWRQGLYPLAITDYEHAAALDPDCGAATALEMARAVMDYRYKDLLNP